MKRYFFLFGVLLAVIGSASPTPRTLEQLLQAQLHSVQEQHQGAFLVEAKFDVNKDDANSSLNTVTGSYAVMGDNVHLYSQTTIWDGVNDEEYASAATFLPAKPGSNEPRVESPELHPAVTEVRVGLKAILQAIKDSKHEFRLARVTVTTVGRIRGRSPVYGTDLAAVPDDKSIIVIEDAGQTPTFFIVLDATTGIPLSTGTYTSPFHVPGNVSSGG